MTSPLDAVAAEIAPLVGEALQVIRRVLPSADYTVRLFGSWVTGRAQPESDIDLAIDGPLPVDAMMLARMRAALEALPTLRKIDVVDLAAADLPFRERIRRQSIVL